ncbi:hypothetical protein NKJ35_28940 [Mesorhizobium sp. M0136]|uniref:hypothetical protein n=1 Tax=Mesorhizobium sp. M0136 TaxID=2956890 RepID=UPI00333B72F2
MNEIGLLGRRPPFASRPRAPAEAGPVKASTRYLLAALSSMPLVLKSSADEPFPCSRINGVPLPCSRRCRRTPATPTKRPDPCGKSARLARALLYSARPDSPAPSRMAAAVAIYDCAIPKLQAKCVVTLLGAPGLAQVLEDFRVGLA